MPIVLNTSPKKRGTIGSKGKWYSPLTNQIYNFQSSYEREFMNFLDNNKIIWIKNKTRYPYMKENKIHNYIPDFYLPEADMYIEVKGFLRKSDPLKFNAFPNDKKLALLCYDDMIRLNCNVFNPEQSVNKSLDSWPMNILSRSDEWQQRAELSEDLKTKVSSDKFFNFLEDKHLWKKIQN